KVLSAGGISAGSDSAGSMPAGSSSASGYPAGGEKPAGSTEPAGSIPAVITSAFANSIPVYAEATTLPPEPTSIAKALEDPDWWLQCKKRCNSSSIKKYGNLSLYLKANMQ
nr:hypothetical protein [Tanacetum cinerariifolium]